MTDSLSERRLIVKIDDPVEAVNRHKAIAITRSGTRLPIVHWIGRDGDGCEPDDAVSCVAEYGDKFITINLWWFQPVFGN